MSKSSKSTEPQNPMQQLSGDWILHDPDDALAKILKAVKPIAQTEEIRLSEAADRIAAAVVKSDYVLPPVHRSERDGFALRSRDSGDGAELKILGAATAGSAFDGVIKAGTCIRIATGAVIPKGADCVVMFEEVSQSESTILLRSSIKAWEWIAKAGSDMRKGQIVISKGNVMTPPLIAAASALGNQKISVLRRPKAVVFTTGNEVRRAGQTLGDAEVFDGNTNALVALLRQQGVEARCRSTVRDTMKSMCSALTKLSQDFDLIVFTGGTSVGDKDYGRRALDATGKTLVHGVQLKPGKPLLFGMIGKCAVMGLPGFPTSALMVAYHFLLPLADHLCGRHGVVESAMVAELAHEIRPDPNKRFLLPVRFTAEGRVESVFTGSASISSIASADGYLTLEAGAAKLKEGSDVVVTLL